MPDTFTLKGFHKQLCHKLGTNGTCCCNCIFHQKITGHPWVNGKSTMDVMGYGCSASIADTKSVNVSGKHGLCEMWTKDDRVIEKNHSTEELLTSNHADLRGLGLAYQAVERAEALEEEELRLIDPKREETRLKTQIGSRIRYVADEGVYDAGEGIVVAIRSWFYLIAVEPRPGTRPSNDLGQVELGEIEYIEDCSQEQLLTHWHASVRALATKENSHGSNETVDKT